MGLDSVQLLMSFENEFEIQVSDEEAGKIFTLNDMVETVARIKNINENNFEIRQKMLNLMIEFFKSHRNIGVTASSKISDYLNPTLKEWDDLKTELGVKISKPEIYNFESKKITNQIRKIIHWIPRYDWNAMSVEDFAESVCIENYKNLINFKTPRSKYEIYLGIAGITAENMGIISYEIKPEKSFTKDLGID